MNYHKSVTLTTTTFEKAITPVSQALSVRDMKFKPILMLL